MSAMWEVQKAIYDTLKADSTLMALINGIYDEPPTNQNYNYIVIGDCSERPDDNHCKLGYETFINLIIYTKPAGLGYYTAKNILSKIDPLINTKKLTLDSLRMLICEFDNATTFKKDDIRGINARYKVITSKTTNFTI